MPKTAIQLLRIQAKECLEASKRTSDRAVKNELLTAAVWLHDEAVKLERLLNTPRGGGGPSSGAPPAQQEKTVAKLLASHATI